MPYRITSRLIRSVGDTIYRRRISRGRVCVISYHRVLESLDPLLESEPDVKTFRWQMELLAECFNVMPLHDAVVALGKESMPPRAVCITFDDGYRSTYDLALPILKELNLPATVFVSSGYLDEGNMWNDRIIEAVRRLPDGRLDLRDVNLGVHPLDTSDDKKRLIHRLTSDSKYLPPHARLGAALKLESMACGLVPRELMLTREMVLALSRQGIEIGAHTITHPILTSIGDESARYEIEAGKRELEDITGKPVRLFAYPNGKPNMDFDERHVLMAKEAGFTAAFTTAAGAATCNDDTYRIPRCRPWDTTPFLFGLRLLRWLAA